MRDVSSSHRHSSQHCDTAHSERWSNKRDDIGRAMQPASTTPKELDSSDPLSLSIVPNGGHRGSGIQRLHSLQCDTVQLLQRGLPWCASPHRLCGSLTGAQQHRPAHRDAIIALVIRRTRGTVNKFLLMETDLQKLRTRLAVSLQSNADDTRDDGMDATS